MTVPIQPRHYQIEGIEYLTTPRVKLNPYDVHPTLCRALLTDSPGSGKTAQSLWAARTLSHKPILVTAPAFLVNQWFKQIADLYPNASIISFDDTKSKQRDTALHADFYITSVQSLRKDDWFETLLMLMHREHIEVTIIDESHYIKTVDARQSINVRKLTKPMNCPHVFLLTATPITKEANDLYHQLHVIDPHAFHAFHDFLNRFCHFEWTSWGPVNVTLKKSAHQVLEAQRVPTPDKSIINNTGWMLGRTYAQIGLELPPLVEHPPIIHSLSKLRRKAYDEIKFMWQTEMAEGVNFTASSAMEVMHTLRRLTHSPEKITSVLDYIHDDPGPYLIGCSYKYSARDLADQLSHTKNPTTNESYTVTLLTGAVPVDERMQLAKAANTPNSVIVATIPSLTEGVDLSHCNTVYFYEEDFTPGKHYQFMSRVRRHRDNQSVGVTITHDADGTNKLHVDVDPNERPVILRYFHADRTIDQRIHNIQSLRSVNIRDLVKVELVG